MSHASLIHWQFDVSSKWRAITALPNLKSILAEYRGTKYEIQSLESQYQGPEAMAHWHPNRPSPCTRRHGRRHLLDDNPCSG
jgi:hypothetical protein